MSTKYNFNTNLKKILVIGLGQLGLPVAKYAKSRGYDVYGYDISVKAMDRAEETAHIKKASDFKDFDVYIICVSTHKPEDMFSPQIDGLLSIVKKISFEARDGSLVSIESTIPRGTSKTVFEMLGHRLHVVHAPHRWYALEEEEHGVNQLRVIGGICDCCLRVGMQFYDGRRTRGIVIEGEENNNKTIIKDISENEDGIINNENNSNSISSESECLYNNIDIGNSDSSKPSSSLDSLPDDDNSDITTAIEHTKLLNSSSNPQIQNFNSDIDVSAANNTTIKDDNQNENDTDVLFGLGIPMHPVSQIEIAELTKIIENAHRYLQIAFAEDLYLYCQSNNIPFAELKDALNTKWNVNILEPREGIGGHCLPKDTKMFLNSSKGIKSKILQAAIEVDREYRATRMKNLVHQVIEL